VVELDMLNITHMLLAETDIFVTDFTMVFLARLTPAKV